MNDERMNERLRTLSERAPTAVRRSDDELVRGVLERVAQRRSRRHGALAAVALLSVVLIAWFALQGDARPDASLVTTSQVALIDAADDPLELALASSERIVQRMRRHSRQRALEARRRELSVERPSAASWVESRWLLREEDLRAANKLTEADALRVTRLARFPKSTVDERSAANELEPQSGEQQ